MTQKFINIPNKHIKNKIRLFVCGPTVYDYPHIGHARTYLSFDIITRWLRYKKFKVFYLQNITDIDDKIIHKAKEQNVTPKELAIKYTNEYHSAEKLINISSVTKYASASDYIKEMIEQIEKLIENGYAYEIDDGIYFDVNKFADYGKLSRQNVQQMMSGIRVEVNKNKKNSIDFVLWKKNKEGITNKEFDKEFAVIDGNPMWKSPWGPGRPGWHIEDTAITGKEFGPQYEIHGGASELKFPHHESEIAQSEAAYEIKPMVKIWMHTGVLLVNGKKMSKSLKNFVTIKDFEDKFGEDVLRFMIAKNTYRTPIDYTEKIAHESKSALSSIIIFLKKIKFASKKSEGGNIKIDINKYSNLFKKAMDNDFNTPEAISQIFSAIKVTDPKMYYVKKSDLEKVYKFISESLFILGFKNNHPEYSIPDNIKKLASERTSARNNLQFDQSDNLRKKIEQLGYVIEDTPIGQFIYKL